jgi:hypothetical protein
MMSAVVLVALLPMVPAAAPARKWCVLEATDASGQVGLGQLTSGFEKALTEVAPVVTNRQLVQVGRQKKLARASWATLPTSATLKRATGCDVGVVIRITRSFNSWVTSLSAVDLETATSLAEVARLDSRPAFTAQRAQSLVEEMLEGVKTRDRNFEPTAKPEATPEPDPFQVSNEGFTGAAEAVKLETTVEVGGRVGFDHFGVFDTSDATKTTGRDQLEAAVRLKAAHPRATAFASVLVRQDFADTVRNRIEVEEAWVEVIMAPFTLKAGRLLASWGSTTLYSPSDVLNPFDLRDPLRPEKWGTLMVRAAGSFGPVSVELMYLPLPEFNRLPPVDSISPDGQLLGRSRWLRGGVAVPEALPVTFNVGPMVSFAPRPSTSQFAARAEASIGRVDIGVSGAWLLDRFPSLLVSVVPEPGIAPASALVQLDFVPRRVFIVTADAETTFNAVRFAAEGVAFLTADPRATNPDVVDPYFVFDVGADYRTGEFAKGQRLHFFLEFSVARAFSGALSLDRLDRLRYPFPLSILGRVAWSITPDMRLELTGATSLERFDVFVTPRFEWLLFDRVKLQLGLDLLAGDPTAGFFGPYRRNSRFTTSVEARF